jgi:hypothetical protein
VPPLPAGARVPSAPPVVPFGAHEAPEREAIAAGDSTGVPVFLQELISVLLKLLLFFQI